MLVLQVESSFDSGGAVAATVNVTDRSISSQCANGNCRAGIRIDDDGKLFRFNDATSITEITGEWMIGGSSPAADAALFWVERTINSGSLDTDDISTSRIQCNTGDIDLKILQAAMGIASCNVSVDWFDVASGGSAVATATYTLTAEQGT